MLIRELHMPFKREGLPWWLRWLRICLQCRRPRLLAPWVRKIPWRRKWQPTPVFSPREFHGQRSLASYSPLHCKESDMTEPLTHIYFENRDLWWHGLGMCIWTAMIGRKRGAGKVVCMLGTESNTVAIKIGLLRYGPLNNCYHRN